MKRRAYFAGKQPQATSNDNSDVSDDEEKLASARSAKCLNLALSTAKTSVQKVVDAKLIPDAAAINNLPKSKKSRRSRVQAKVLSSNGGSRSEDTVDEIVEKKGRLQPCSAKTITAIKFSNPSEFSRFEPIDKLEKDIDEQLPELNVENNESSDSSSADEQSTDSDDSKVSVHSNSVSLESHTHTLTNLSRPDEHLRPPKAPTYVPNASRIDINRQTSSMHTRRDIEKNERERALREQTLRAVRHTIEESEYDLKHVDMSVFPDDCDRPEDYEEEYALWRVRELKRVMRERGIDTDGGSNDE